MSQRCKHSCPVLTIWKLDQIYKPRIIVSVKISICDIFQTAIFIGLNATMWLLFLRRSLVRPEGNLKLNVKAVRDDAWIQSWNVKVDSFSHQFSREFIMQLCAQPNNNSSGVHGFHRSFCEHEKRTKLQKVVRSLLLRSMMSNNYIDDFTV